MDVSVVLPAGGIGRRMGGEGPKQFLHHRGKSMLQWSVEAFLALGDQLKAVVLPLPEPFLDEPPEWIAELDPRIVVCQGGATRQESVHKGFETLVDLGLKRGVWLVHDAARPLLSEDDLSSLLEKISSTGQGALLASPVRDTVKKANGKEVISTVDRRDLWLAQTPQGAPASLMWSASTQALSDGWEVTDDASLLEQHGVPVHLVEGDPSNFKVTLPSDWDLFCHLT